MYKVDDIIAYSSQGICRISEITEMEVGGKKMQYYILKPVFDSRSTISVPVSNEKLTSRMREVITREKAESIMSCLADKEIIWIDDDNKRREAYGTIISEGNPDDMAVLYKTLVLRRQELESLSRKLRTADESFLRQAEKLLCCECCYAGIGEQHAIRERLLGAIL